MSSRSEKQQQSRPGMVKAAISVRAVHIAVGIVILVLAGIVLAYPGTGVILIAV